MLPRVVQLLRPMTSPDDFLTRPAPLVAALLVAAVIAGGALRARSLTPAGAAAAFVTGTVALLSGWGWGIFLIVWFAAASVLSRLGRHEKTARTRGLVDKGDRRDAQQVFANGGLFALCAVSNILARVNDSDAVVSSMRGPYAWLAVAAVGALAAAGADTWATEIGTLVRGRPWSLRTRTRVPVGTSGAITAAGTAAALVGAFVLSSTAAVLGVIPHESVPAAVLGGFAGAVGDTVLGAWVQSRRWCPACHVATEQHVHSCGTHTSLAGGIGVLNNDAVNFACTLVGALVALSFAVLLR